MIWRNSSIAFFLRVAWRLSSEFFCERFRENETRPAAISEYFSIRKAGA
jgi:hypothetical protein